MCDFNSSFRLCVLYHKLIYLLKEVMCISQLIKVTCIPNCLSLDLEICFFFYTAVSTNWPQICISVDGFGLQFYKSYLFSYIAATQTLYPNEDVSLLQAAFAIIRTFKNQRR